MVIKTGQFASYLLWRRMMASPATKRIAPSRYVTIGSRLGKICAFLNSVTVRAIAVGPKRRARVIGCNKMECNGYDVPAGSSVTTVSQVTQAALHSLLPVPEMSNYPH